MRIIWLSLFLVCAVLGAEEENFEQTSIPSSSLASTTGLLPTFINGSVCAITGEYVDSAVDLICLGPEPLVLERSYSSGNHSSSYLCNSWHLNYSCNICADRFKGNKKYRYNATVETPTGSVLSYKSKQRPGSDDFFLDLDIKKGLTNCGRGVISARTNLKNQTLKFIDDKNKAIVTSPTGELYKFRSFKEEVDWDKNEYFFLTQIERLNGTRTRISYNDEYAHKKCFPQKITSRIDNLEYAHIKLERAEKKIFKTNPVISASASSGQKVKYHFEEFGNSFYLSHVETKHKPWEKYEYVKTIRAKYDNEKDKYQISKKEWPKGRFIKNEYYTKGKNDLGFTSVYLNKGDDFCLGKVKSQENPYYVTHRFWYEEGVTRVYDAYTHKTTYRYNSEDRPTELKKWKGVFENYDLYSVEYFLWQEDLLKGKYLVDKKGSLHSGRFFVYDDYGNIEEEKFYGNLTGTLPAPTIENQTPSGENYSKKYEYSKDEWHLLLTETEENGRQISYRYKGGTDLITARYLIDGNAIKLRQFYEYNDANLLIQVTIDDGNTYEKDNFSGATERRITRIFPRMTEPVGVPERVDELALNLATGEEEFIHRTISDYSLEGHLCKQDHYDNLGVHQYTLRWEYDAHGNVTKEINALGIETIRKYDDNDNLTYEKGPDGEVFYSYDLCNQLTKEKKQTEYGPLITRHSYTKMGQLESTTDIFGQITEFKYDEFGRMVSKHLPKMNGVIPEIKMDYDIAGCLTSCTDPRGHKTKTRYNARGKPIEIRYPDGTKETRTYRKDGKLWQIFAPNGLITCYDYDYLGRVTSETKHEADSTPIHGTYHEYTAFHLKSTTDPAGLVTRYEYDARGRLACTCTGNRKTTYTYDTLNRVALKAEWIDDKALTTEYEYDLLNRVTQVTSEDSKIQYEYDNHTNNLIKTITSTPSGASTQSTEYDSLHQPIKIKDGLGNVTHIEYDYSHPTPDGKVLKITTTDPLGNQTSTIHDNHQRVACIEHKNNFGMLTAKQEIHYDLAGNKIEEIHHQLPQGSIQTIQWEYNAVNQITRLQEGQKTTHYTYNTAGQMDKLIKPDGVEISYTYDAQGRLAVHSGPDFSYAYQYDNQHHPIAIIDQIEKTSTKREYNLYGDLLSETLATGHKLSYKHDSFGRKTQITFPDSSQIDYIYDMNYLKEIKRNSYTHTYKYDLGLLTSSQLMTGEDVNYRYDLLSRLTETHAKHYSQTNIYDPNDNLVSKEIKDPLGSYKDHFTYNDLNHLLSENDTQYTTDSLGNRHSKNNITYTFNSKNELAHQNGIDYKYSPNGNLITKNENGKITKFRYDSLDRLIAVNEDKTITTYVYDGFNRRIAKMEGDLTSEDEGITHYLYDEDNEIGAIQNGKITQLRLLGIGKGAEIGAAVALEIDNQLYIPLHDHNGNVTVLLDKHGQTVETYHYTAFGEEEIFGPDNQPKKVSINPWRFSSKRHDPETGFIYFGHRYYDPSIGRWTTPDPIGTADGPNFYAYLHHNPLTSIDLYGMFTMHFGNPDNLSELTDVVSDFAKPYFVNRETNFSTPFRTNCTFKSSALRSWDDDFRTMMQGVGHGALDFGISTYHGFQTGAAYFGSMDLEMGASSCYHMLQPIMQSQNERLEHIGSHYKRLIGIQEYDSLYELTRSRTRTGLEAASVAAGVYGTARGVISATRLAKTTENALPILEKTFRISELKFSKTAGKHFHDLVKSGRFKGQLDRPYMRSLQTVNEIMSAGKPISDPKNAIGTIRWDIPGAFRGSEGIWELVFHPESQTIYHFNFITI